MMSQKDANVSDAIVHTVNAGDGSDIVLVCEHASNFIPPEFDNLGLQAEHLKTHIAWDPGAYGVASHLSQKLDAALVASNISRLVYDVNRPPEADDAMPVRSEIFDIPGNSSLSASDRADRVARYYTPFRNCLARQIGQTSQPVIVTIHSFTPVFYGAPRPVEIGVLHDEDARLADAMLGCASFHTRANVKRNQPYDANHGVTHTLKEHALPHGYLNVMLEIRNDLIGSDRNQGQIAGMLAAWLRDAICKTGLSGDQECSG